MKNKLFFVLLLLIFSFSLIKAQTISNVKGKQQENNVIITYNLQCDEAVDIDLFVSKDNGNIFIGPLEKVTGDVGAGISSGSKTIIWNTLQEMDMITGDHIIFRVKGFSKFGKFIDRRDGKNYKIVKIGNQVLMAENLNYDFGINWCYENSISNCKQYGRFYDWETANIVCPSGWHLPSKEEFETLLKNTSNNGSSSYEALIKNGISGFSSLMSGWVHPFININYEQMGLVADFWSNTSYNYENAWKLEISIFHGGNATINNFPKKWGFSVRCLRD